MLVGKSTSLLSYTKYIGLTSTGNSNIKECSWHVISSISQGYFWDLWEISVVERDILENLSFYPIRHLYKVCPRCKFSEVEMKWYYNYHSTKLDFRFCAGSYTARGVSGTSDKDSRWKWTLFYKQDFYKQRQAETGKKSSKS